MEYSTKLVNEENIKERMLDNVLRVNHELQLISKEDMMTAVKRMRSGKVIYPIDMPVDAAKCLGEFLARFLNKILKCERMLGDWRNVLVPRIMCRAVVTIEA